MQIIIPMTGHGSRFKNAGYSRLKPFIEVQGRPIIEWVVGMFPGDTDKIVFICRQEHLDTLDYMEPELRRVAPQGRIVPIRDWEKTGPVGDVLKAADCLDDHEAAIICYCDFYMRWDYSGFKREADLRRCDGSVPCYTGFHPHLLPAKNLYASCKVDQAGNLIEIREKFSWERDKTKALHSPGVYYFRTGSLLKRYCRKLVEAGDHLNGEYYASLPYNHMVKDGLTVWCPANVEFFCQWGTPEDLEDYLFWTELVRNFHKGDK